MNKESWHNIETKDVLNKLITTIDGLTSVEAQKRVDQHGPNTLPKKKKDTVLKIVLSQFVNPIIYILIVTAILSIIVSHPIDAIFIAVVILIDVSLGAFQEWKAGKDSESLQKLIKIKAKVLRDNKEIKIDSEDLVIGDIVLLESGDKIPADLRLIDVKNLTVDESILTGESQSSTKFIKTISIDTLMADRDNLAYAGTSVATGRGIGVVVAIGENTEIGQIASTVLLSDSTKSPLVLRMEKFTTQISYFMGIIAIVIAFFLYFKGYATQEIFYAVIGITVSAIPEGLPVALTLALSIASSRMAKKNIIVKKLNSVESLGSCTVIASDKTGTLTLNQQTAKKIVTPDGHEYDVEGTGYNGIGKVSSSIADNDFRHATELATLGAINNEASLSLIKDEWKSHGDSVDIAFLSLAYKLNIKSNIKAEKNIKAVIPYESVDQYSAVFYEEETKIYCTTKGSVEKVLEFCNTMLINGKQEPLDKNIIIKQNESLARKGYRVIALSKGETIHFDSKENHTTKDIPKSTLIGLVAFIDPIREEAAESIKKCQNAGIKVVMITGDHPLTAYAIAKEINIVKNYDGVTNGEEIDKYINLGEVKFDEFIKTKTVFTRITPLQKLEIVESYKRQKEFIAVTGDGVNDAPALKAANIGVAMGSGTDVAKETGTMIIVDDNFLSIVAAVEEGRNAYNNVRKVIYLLISTGLSEVLFITFAILFNMPIPLAAVQLLWLNLVTNGIQDAALAFEKAEPGIMDEQPRKTNEKIFNKLLLQETIVSGITISIIVFGFWYYLINERAMEVLNARGYVLLLMVFIQNIHVFNCRSEKTSAFKVPFKNNPFIVIGVLTALGLHLLVTEVTVLSNIINTTVIPLNEIPFIFMLAIPILIVMETFKKIKRKQAN